MSDLTRAEQEQLITATKTALELPRLQSKASARRARPEPGCVGDPGCYGLCLQSGLRRRSKMFARPRADVLPYRSPVYSFWLFRCMRPTTRPLVRFLRQSVRQPSAADWEALLKSEFDKQQAANRPLLVEFHPKFSAVDEGRFQAYVSFLDYAVEHGAEFMSVAEYVAWAEDADAACNE